MLSFNKDISEMVPSFSKLSSNSAWLEGPLAEVSNERLRHDISTVIKSPSTTTAPDKKRLRRLAYEHSV